jgi:predicted O-methyltransferase YrrM
MTPEIICETPDGTGPYFTYVNGVRGTLKKMDVSTLIHYARQLEEGSKYMEVGSYLGCSALIVALHSNATVWAHDIWVSDWDELPVDQRPPREQDYFYSFYSAVKKNNLCNRVIPIRGKSSYTIGIHDDSSLDMAFIDGDHSYEGCLNDLEMTLPKMKPGSHILVHDCIPGSGAEKAVRVIIKRIKYEFDFIKDSWGMMVIHVPS